MAISVARFRPADRARHGPVRLESTPCPGRRREEKSVKGGRPVNKEPALGRDDINAARPPSGATLVETRGLRGRRRGRTARALRHGGPVVSMLARRRDRTARDGGLAAKRPRRPAVDASRAGRAGGEGSVASPRLGVDGALG